MFNEAQILDMCILIEKIMYILKYSCENSKAEQVSRLAEAMQELAFGYAEKLMAIKKHGVENGIQISE